MQLRAKMKLEMPIQVLYSSHSEGGFLKIGKECWVLMVPLRDTWDWIRYWIYCLSFQIWSFYILDGFWIEKTSAGFEISCTQFAYIFSPYYIWSDHRLENKFPRLPITIPSSSHHHPRHFWSQNHYNGRHFISNLFWILRRLAKQQKPLSFQETQLSPSKPYSIRQARQRLHHDTNQDSFY